MVVDEVAVAEQQIPLEGHEEHVSTTRYSPATEGTPTAPVLVWLHGGGFFRGSRNLPEADQVAKRIAETGTTVITVGYSLAPPPGLTPVYRVIGRPVRHHPSPFDEVSAVLSAVDEESQAGVVIGGASAGACIAAAVARASVINRSPRIRGVALAYGFFHSVISADNAEVNNRSQGHRRFTHSIPLLDAMNRSYVGGRARLSDPTAFPGGHGLVGFPPTLMVDAEHDNFRASSDLFSQELRDAGVAVTRHVLTGSAHAFLNRPGSEHFERGLALLSGWITDLRAAKKQ